MKEALIKQLEAKMIIWNEIEHHQERQEIVDYIITYSDTAQVENRESCLAEVDDLLNHILMDCIREAVFESSLGMVDKDGIEINEKTFILIDKVLTIVGKENERLFTEIYLGAYKAMLEYIEENIDEH